VGARINFIFKDTDPAVGEPSAYVVLYSHWGQTDWQPDIAAALTHSRARWSDSSYATRMMISYLIQDSVLDEHGFGIYAINNESWDLGEQSIVVDFVNNTITDIHPVEFNAFINAYAPHLSLTN
jgi:hypothetical protein